MLIHDLQHETIPLPSPLIPGDQAEKKSVGTLGRRRIKKKEGKPNQAKDLATRRFLGKKEILGPGPRRRRDLFSASAVISFRGGGRASRVPNTRHYGHLIISLCPVYCSAVENGDDGGGELVADDVADDGDGATGVEQGARGARREGVSGYVEREPPRRPRPPHIGAGAFARTFYEKQ